MTDLHGFFAPCMKWQKSRRGLYNVPCVFSSRGGMSGDKIEK